MLTHTRSQGILFKGSRVVYYVSSLDALDFMEEEGKVAIINDYEKKESFC
ncbi:MAG: hypothetical protein ACPLW8_04465 [Candidatus Bathyarchaeales archaeon]